MHEIVLSLGVYPSCATRTACSYQITLWATLSGGSSTHKATLNLLWFVNSEIINSQETVLLNISKYVYGFCYLTKSERDMFLFKMVRKPEHISIVWFVFCGNTLQLTKSSSFCCSRFLLFSSTISCTRLSHAQMSRTCPHSALHHICASSL